jgi:xanthine/uracil permease
MLAGMSAPILSSDQVADVLPLSFFLIIMGIFSKFAAALVSIPSAVLGGMTTFLFTSVAVSGIRIVSTITFTRRSMTLIPSMYRPGVLTQLVQIDSSLLLL